MKTHAINPKIINLKLFDLFKVFITSIDANAVIIKRKNGMDNIECKLCFKKILLYPLLINSWKLIINSTNDKVSSFLNKLVILSYVYIDFIVKLFKSSSLDILFSIYKIDTFSNFQSLLSIFADFEKIFSFKT